MTDELPELTDEEREAMNRCDVTEILGTWEERCIRAQGFALRMLRERDTLTARLAEAEARCQQMEKEATRKLSERDARIKRLEHGLFDLGRHEGYREINNGTSTIGMFVKLLLNRSEQLQSEGGCSREELRERLRGLAEAVQLCEWELPIDAMETCIEAADEIEYLEHLTKWLHE